MTKKPPLIYNMTSKYGPYLYHKNQVLKELKKFILAERAKTKIAISNLAWEKSEEEKIVPLLKKYQIAGVEIAPSKIWPDPTKVTKEVVTKYKNFWNQNGIQIVAITSLLFGHPELTLFENKIMRGKTLTYLKKMLRLTSWLGAKILVFGSPKNRLRGILSQNHADKIAVSFFRKLGQEAKKHKVNFCLEPIPQIYGADYLTNTTETIKLIKKIKHPNIKINLDTGSMKINRENFEKTIKKALLLTGHLHLSEKGFKSFSDQKFGHGKISKILNKLKYANWASIEIWAEEKSSNINSVENSLKFIKKTYE